MQVHETAVLVLPEGVKGITEVACWNHVQLSVLLVAGTARATDCYAACQELQGMCIWCSSRRRGTQPNTGLC